MHIGKKGNTTCSHSILMPMEAEPDEHFNRLGKESSPYLLMHAKDLIDWFPWGKEAILLAQQEQKPLYLSIGYASSHWCQKMQREVFSNPEVAQQLNEYFINIKVDREEREDVEKLYMRFSQALIGDFVTLPLNIFLTPDLKPFFAKGYTPLNSHFGSMGMLELIEKVKQLWYTEEQEEMRFQAERVVELFEDEQSPPERSEMISYEEMDHQLLTLFQLVDPLYGGISSLPKSIQPCHLLFLLSYSQVRKSARSFFYLNRTLNSMCQGGLYDVLEGGFGVYSVERNWRAAHFEKLLADNALLAEVYLLAYMYTENNHYKQVGLKTLDFVLKQLACPQGGFYSALFSEVDGRQGLYNSWSYSELKQRLKDYPLHMHFLRYYDVSASGNFEGRNLLHAKDSLKHYAAKQKLSYTELEKAFDKMLKLLEEVRKEKKKPELDRKIVLSYNALTVHSLLLAYRLNLQDSYRQRALNTLDYLLAHFQNEQGFIHYLRSSTVCKANLLDLTALVRSLITAFTETGLVKYLEQAEELSEYIEENFLSEEGGYVFSSDMTLLFSQVDFQDKRLPSSNALHTENLLRLYQLTQKKKYHQRALNILERLSGHLQLQPLHAYYHLLNRLKFDDCQGFYILYCPKGFDKTLREMVNFSACYQQLIVWVESFSSEFLERFGGLNTLQHDFAKPLLICIESGKVGKCYGGTQAIGAYFEEEN